jgi:serine/threonine protein kinase
MDADVVERFKREVQVLNLLQNPHNIRVYNYGELY